MKKMTILLFVFFCGGMIAFAQVREPANPQKDKQEYRGYTIHLTPAMQGTFNYYIVKDKHVVLSQTRNPFTGSVFGLSKKEDAYKVAQWQIEHAVPPPAPHMASQKQIPGFAKMPPALQQRLQKMRQEKRPLLRSQVPKNVAGELNISLHH